MRWPWASKKEKWEHNRELYYRMADVVLMLNLEGKIVGVIRSSPRHPVSEKHIGKYLRELLGPEQGLKGAQAMREALGNDKRTTYPYSLKDGENAYYYEAQLLPLPRAHRGKEERVLWLAYDRTEAKQNESSLWMRNELLEGVLNARISLMSESKAEKEVLAESLKIIGNATKADRVFILEHYQSPYYQVLSLQREWCHHGVASQLGNAAMEQIEYDELLPGWLSGMLKSGYKYFNVDELPEAFRAVLRVSPTQWILMMPVFKEQALWGVLGIEFHRPHKEWTPEEIAILKAATGSISGWVTAEEAKKDLKMAKLEAEKANKAKSEFLAVISHELRTPMNAILGYSQLLHQSIQDKEHKEQISFIERSGRSLLDLINNILDFSKPESRGVELEIIPFSMEQVIMEALETCSIKAREKGITLDYQLPQGFPATLLGDPHRLKQILLNLINNAVKFTSHGGVHLHIDSKEMDNKLIVHCAIKDTGIGIDPHKATRLFKAFSQADSSTTRQYGGTGLGLAIAKKLVESMGGKIWVESAVGEGSVFHFTVQMTEEVSVVSRPHPTSPRLAPPPMPAPSAASNSSQRLIAGTEKPSGELDGSFASRFPMRILLVEDDPMNQKLASKLLERLGYGRVDCAIDGIEALRRINEGSYDMILSDLQMPRLDGIGMTRRLRMGECGPAKKNTPIVGLTAYAMSEDKERCLEAGMTEFMRKPIVVAELKESIIKAYHHRIRLRN